jgi:hypothetical protein
VRLPDLPNDDEHVALLRAVIGTLAEWYDGEYSGVRVTIDPTTYNPARIMALVGTMKCKGRSLKFRPHRRVTLDSPLDKERTPLDPKAWLGKASQPREDQPASPRPEDNGQAPLKAKKRSRSQRKVDDQVSAGDNGKPPHDHDDVLRAAMKSEGFRTLWEGRWQGTSPSQSEADEGLASRLAFYCGPGQEEQVKRLFRQSGLGERAKAERDDYLTRTVRKAYEGRDEGKYFQWSDRGDYYEADGKLFFDGEKGPISLASRRSRDRTLCTVGS